MARILIYSILVSSLILLLGAGRESNSRSFSFAAKIENAERMSLVIGGNLCIASIDLAKPIFEVFRMRRVYSISIRQIEGKEYIEGLTEKGSLYAQLTRYSGNSSVFVLGRTLVGCESGGYCKNCKFTGGQSCGCGNGSNDCVFVQDGFGRSVYVKPDSNAVKKHVSHLISPTKSASDSLKTPKKPAAEGQSVKKI